MTVLGLIPARGGSKGIPGKNLVSFGGKPLIARTIETAIASGVINRLVVSTDDHKIADVALRYGAEVPFMRPPELARDDTATAPVISHAVEALAFNGAIALLQPTSPLRSAEDISRCVELHKQLGKTIISITETKIHPSWMFGLDDGNKIIASEVSERRQKGNPRFVPNGAVYVFDSSTGLNFKEAIGYVMPAERSCDIDTPHDLRIANFELEYRNLVGLAASL